MIIIIARSIFDFWTVSCFCLCSQLHGKVKGVANVSTANFFKHFLKPFDRQTSSFENVVRRNTRTIGSSKSLHIAQCDFFWKGTASQIYSLFFYCVCTRWSLSGSQCHDFTSNVSPSNIHTGDFAFRNARSFFRHLTFKLQFFHFLSSMFQPQKWTWQHSTHQPESMARLCQTLWITWHKICLSVSILTINHHHHYCRITCMPACCIDGF